MIINNKYFLEYSKYLLIFLHFRLKKIVWPLTFTLSSSTTLYKTLFHFIFFYFNQTHEEVSEDRVEVQRKKRVFLTFVCQTMQLCLPSSMEEGNPHGAHHQHHHYKQKSNIVWSLSSCSTHSSFLYNNYNFPPS